MAILEEYWSGVLRRLEAEVDTFNRLIDHQGEMGRENELSLARILERLVPPKYGIGSGLLIDSQGNYSKQIDIVIYDNSDEPSLMAQTNQVLFPVENVRLCIEVKTTADKAEIEDAGAKMSSVRNLNSHGTHPYFALVGYTASTTAKTIATHLKSGEIENRLDFACILQLGIFASKASLAPTVVESEENHVVGVTLLHNRDGRTRIPGSFMIPAVDDHEPDLLYDGHRYPIVDVLGYYYACEPSRALLLFCESMLNSLSSGSRSVLSHYLTEIGREIKRL